MAQIILTFITEINTDKRVRLEELLEQVRKNLDNNPYIPFASLTRLHFMSLVIIDNNDGYGAYLVFENNFDGPLDSYLNELLQHAGKGLHEIYLCCTDYPGGAYNASQLAAYLKAHVVLPNAYHIGNVGRSAERIRQENRLLMQIQSRLDTLVAAGRSKDAPSVLRQDVQQFVRSDSSLTWAVDDIGPRQTTAERVVPWIKVIAAAIGAIILSPVLIPLAVIWVIILRKKEKSDPSNSHPVNTEHIQKLNEQEDRIVQNHLASVTLVKPGWFRRTTLRVVLWLVNLLARTANKGELSGIPSIHFAHWSMIDNGRRLLFLSNFDGSWNSYLDDFIDKATYGLTAVWTNTVGFPPTRFLIYGGAQNEADFKSFSRDSQSPTLVWYSAYPNLTVQNIDKDSLIREDLFSTLDENATKTWLRLF